MKQRKPISLLSNKPAITVKDLQQQLQNINNKNIHIRYKEDDRVTGLDKTKPIHEIQITETAIYFITVYDRENYSAGKRSLC